MSRTIPEGPVQTVFAAKGPLAIVVGLVVMAGFAALSWLVYRAWFANGKPD